MNRFPVTEVLVNFLCKNGTIGDNNFNEVSITFLKVYLAAFLDESLTSSLYNLYFTASMYSSQNHAR